MRKLTRRERTLLLVMGGVVAFAAAYYLIVSPMIDYMKNSDEETRKNQESLNRLDKIYEDYKDVQAKKTAHLALLRNKNENITTLIEQWANSTNIARNIAYTRGTQSTIQNKFTRVTTNVKIEGVPIQSLIKFLYEIESSNQLLNLSYLRIYQGLKGADTYDAVIKIDSFTMQ